MKKRKHREFWLTKQNRGRMSVADVWYSDPRKVKHWKPEWDKDIIHVREILPRAKKRA